MRPLFFNLAAQWAGALYAAAVSLGLVFVVGRSLGPRAFGNYSYALTVAILFVVVQDGGFKRLIFREKTLPSAELLHHQENLMPWALGHASVSTVIGVTIALTLPVAYHIEIALAFFCLGLQAVVVFISAELRARGMFAQDAQWQAIARSLSAGGILLSIFLLGAQPAYIFLGWALGLIASLLLSPIPLTRPKVAGFRVKKIRRACMAFMGAEAATMIYSRSDIILLKYFSDCPEQVGYYAAAYRFLEGIALLSGPLSFIWFRNLRLNRKDKGLFRSKLVKTALIMLAGGTIVGVFGMEYSEAILDLTFGKGYADSAPILACLLIALVFILPNTILTQAAIAQNMERLYAISACLAALVNVTLNMMLIPEYGGLGAAWAAISTAGVLCLTLAFGVLKAI